MLLSYLYYANGNMTATVRTVYRRIFNGMNDTMRNVKIVGEVQSLVSIYYDGIKHKIGNILTTNVSYSHSLIVVVLRTQVIFTNYPTSG